MIQTAILVYVTNVQIKEIRAGKKETRIKDLRYYCVVCNKMFVPKTRDQKVCSSDCRKVRNREYSREYQTMLLARDRFIILERDHFKCIYCGKSSIEEEIELHIDHVFPYSLGGKTTASNLITACRDCNESKGNRELDQEDSERILAKIKQRNIQSKIRFDMKIHLGRTGDN